MKKRRRGISLGTVIMLLLTVLSLVGFLALMPSFTGHQDVRLDAVQLAVAMDESLAQLAAVSGEHIRLRPQSTILPPESLATALPHSPASQPTATSQPAVTAQPELSFSLSAVGSILCNTTVRKALTIDDVYRFDILTDQLKGAFAADLSLATLEHTVIENNRLDNVNMPAALLSPLAATGINVLDLGHPNILNSGMDGLSATAQAVRSAGMMPLGVYVTADERAQGTWLNLNGCSVALLHYQEEVSSTSRKQSTEEERQLALAELDPEAILADIADVRERGAQVVLVSLCWGKEGASAPTDEQIALAQAMADAGADIIIGTHSGVLQPVQLLAADRGDGKYHPVLCAYSLGYLFSPDRESRQTLTSILLETEVAYHIATGCIAFENLTYTPTYAWRGKQDGRTLYRILLNDNRNYPSFVDDSQRSVMERSYTLATSVMADTGIPLAE